MKPSDFLPSFFKKAAQAFVPNPNQYPKDWTGNMDPQGGIWENPPNLLAPDDQKKPIVAPVITAPVTEPAKPVIPFKSPALPPVNPIDMTIPGDGAAMPTWRPGDLAATYSGAPSGAAISTNVAREMGHVGTSSRGRPQPLPTELDPASDEKTLAVNKAYQNYDPAAQPSKGWKKWVPTMISGALRGFGNGGLGGAIFGAAEGGIGGAVDPSRANREWQRKKLGETAPVVAGIQKERKAQADIEEQKSQTQERLAGMMPDPSDPTRMIKRPPTKAPQYVERQDGVYEISADSPNGRKLGDIPSEVKAEKQGDVHYFEREDGVYGAYKDAEGATKSFKVEGIPGKPTADTQSPQDTAKAKAVREAKLNLSSSLYKKAEAMDGNATALDVHIKNLQDGMATIDDSDERKPFQSQIDDLKKQQTKLREDAQNLRTDGDKARSEGESVPAVAAPAADPLKGKQWSKSRYKGSKNVDIAAKEAAARGAIVVP